MAVIQKFGGYITVSDEMLASAVFDDVIKTVAETVCDNSLAERGYKRIGDVSIRQVLDYEKPTKGFKLFCVVSRAIPEQPQYEWQPYQLGGKAC